MGAVLTKIILIASLKIIEFWDIKKLFFPEEGGRTFHPNFATFLPDFTSSHPRQLCSFANRSVNSMSVPSVQPLGIAQYWLLTKVPFALYIRHRYKMLP